MAQPGSGENQTDNQLYTMIMLFIVLLVVFVMRYDILQSWMESTYSRLLWLSSWPLVGSFFAEMAADYRANPVFSNTIKYDYFIGWFFGLAIVPLLIWAGIRAHRARRIWSNRLMTPIIFDGAIGRKKQRRFRQALTLPEWIDAVKLDEAYENGAWQGRFRQFITMQVTSAGEARANDPVLLAFLAYLELDSQLAAKVVSEHKYLATAMVRIFAYARAKHGVVQEHGFAEKLLTDRNLAPIYFALQSLGGNCVFSEAIGIMEHYQAELAIHRPIKTIQTQFAEETMRHILEVRKSEREKNQKSKWEGDFSHLELD